MNQNNEGTTLFRFARETILSIFYCRNFPLKYRSVSKKFERKLRILVQFKPRYRLQKNIMGQQFSSIQQINRLYQMPLGQYGLKERISSALSLWKRRNPPYQQLIESRMVVNTQRELSEIYDIFKMRHMHQYLPATRYLTCQHHGIKGCGQYYQGNLYFDNAIATLSMINDIPFFDSLHLLSAALKGYQILYKKFGYFDIFEDMFHICENGKVKVWCNSQIHKLRPQQYLLDPSGKEEDMIYRIINMIDENVDKSDKYNLKNQLYAKLRNGTHFQSFDHVNIIFRQLCKEKGWATPERLKCISLLTRQDIQKLLVLQDKINKSQKQIHINQPNLLTLNSFTEGTNDAYLKNNFQGKTSLRLPPTQNQQKKNHFQENNSNFSIKNAKSSVINLLNSLPPANLQNNLSSPSAHPSSPTLRSFPIAPKEPPHYLTMRSNTPQMKFRPRIQTPQSRPTIRMVSVERPTIKIENKMTPFPPFQNNAVLLNRNATTNITPNYYVQLSPRFNPNTVLNNQIKNQRAMVQNVIRIPVSPRQRNIQTNINPQYIFQPQPQSQHLHQPQQQHQNQKFPIHFVHNQNNSVQKQTSLSNLKSTDRNPHLIEQKNKSFKKLDQSFNNLHNRREESKQIKPNNFQYQYKNNSNKSPTPKSIVISDSIYKNNSNSRSNYSKQRQKQIEREIQLNSFKFNSQAHEQTIQPSEIPKFQSIQQFHQRFEQSIISPEQSMRSRPSKRQFQLFQQNNKEITDQTRRSKKRLPNIQYTDPHLIQLLSPKRNQKQININETDSNLGNKQSLSKDLYYSFSQTSLNQRQKQLQKLQTLQITQQSSTHTFSNMFDRNLPNYSDLQVINSSPQVSLRDQVTKRKYQIGIDEEIWKDYIKLKKNKNMN